MTVEALSNDEMTDYIIEHKIPCPGCGKSDFTGIRKLNMMFKTFQGVTEDSTTELSLRPETAQGIFVNFKNILRTSRRKLPFGVCQIGKSFRNEITPGNFTFRTREFEQMELEFFCKPGEDLEWFDYGAASPRLSLSLGMTEEHLRLRDRKRRAVALFQCDYRLELLFPLAGATSGRCRPHELRPYRTSERERRIHGIFRSRYEREVYSLRY